MGQVRQADPRTRKSGRSAMRPRPFMLAWSLVGSAAPRDRLVVRVPGGVAGSVAGTGDRPGKPGPSSLKRPGGTTSAGDGPGSLSGDWGAGAARSAGGRRCQLGARHPGDDGSSAPGSPRSSIPGYFLRGILAGQAIVAGERRGPSAEVVGRTWVERGLARWPLAAERCEDLVSVRLRHAPE